MKKKIAILTQPLGHNYGGIIQNYALQKVLHDMGYETVTINRRKDNSHSKFRVLLSNIKTKIFRNVIRYKDPIYFDYNIISANTQRFLKTHIDISPVIKTTAELTEYFDKEKFNKVVVGSDQVWRPKYSPNIFNFYLDFIQDNNSLKKLSYAASFGTEDWEYTEEETRRCKQLIQQFDAVSVREKSGINLCSKHLNAKYAQHVVDPTLLLDANDYSELINLSPKNMGLFTYVLDESDEKIAFINQCAKELKLNISKNQPKYKTKAPKSNNIQDYIIPPLEGWLQGFRDAKFIITDSFHGTVFSIINKKPFLTLVNQERGASRFESILSKLGLEDRMVYDVNAFDPSLLHKNIDYETVHQKLNALKEESLNFLKDNL